MLALLVTLLLAASPGRLLVPDAPVRLKDFAEAPAYALPRPPLWLVIGKAGGVGGVDPLTGLTRWKKTFSGLKRWQVEGDFLLLEGDALTRQSLDGGDPEWEYQLGCDQGTCSLHVLGRDASTIYLGGIGAVPDQLMPLDARTGRERWPSWLPLGEPVGQVFPGAQRLLVLPGRGSGTLLAISPTSGARAWSASLDSAPARPEEVRVSDLGPLVCVVYQPQGNPDATNVDLLDASSGATRLSRTLAAARPEQVLCAPGPRGAPLLVSPRAAEVLDPATLATTRRVGLPNSLRLALPTEPDPLLVSEKGLARLSASTLLLHADLDLPLGPECRRVPEGLRCPDLLVTLPRQEAPGEPLLLPPDPAVTALAFHPAGVTGMAAAHLVPYRRAQAAELSPAFLKAAPTSSLEVLLRRYAVLKAIPDALPADRAALGRAAVARMLLDASSAEDLSRRSALLAARAPDLSEAARSAASTFRPDLPREAPHAECEAECLQAYADAAFLFPTAANWASEAERCARGCRAGAPTSPSLDAPGRRGSENWWKAVLGGSGDAPQVPPQRSP
jgi:hypothetical protein